MAIIDTAANLYIETKDELVCVIRKALIEELAAIDTYDRLVRTANMMGAREVGPNGESVEVPPNKLSQAEAKKIADFFQEIKDDEITHSGALIDLMQSLDPGIKTLMSGRV